MSLDTTPVNRNLYTRVTFMALEFEDLFLVLGLAAVMNVLSRFVSGQMSAYLQYGVPIAVVPVLMAFKYGKPRGYFRDLFHWYAKQRVYCAIAADRQIQGPYIQEESN
jgi:hypothetical protein